MLRARSTCTTLGYMPNGSGSSFCTRFSLPSFDISAPGTCRENLDRSSKTEYRDRERRIGCAVAGVGASTSESESSFFSSGHRVGYSVVRLYLFSMACSKAGSIVALENEVWCSVEHGSADPRVLLRVEWYVSETWSRLPITTGQGLANDIYPIDRACDYVLYFRSRQIISSN
tara:strand:+ start:804 stop:1322 length:519 start_codon:yes stop_codon:yes gene_type:complete